MKVGKLQVGSDGRDVGALLPERLAKGLRQWNFNAVESIFKVAFRSYIYMFSVETQV
jgi:hypothetical protein